MTAHRHPPFFLATHCVATFTPWPVLGRTPGRIGPGNVDVSVFDEQGRNNDFRGWVAPPYGFDTLPGTERDGIPRVWLDDDDDSPVQAHVFQVRYDQDDTWLYSGPLVDRPVFRPGLPVLEATVAGILEALAGAEATVHDHLGDDVVPVVPPNPWRHLPPEEGWGVWEAPSWHFAVDGVVTRALEGRAILDAALEQQRGRVLHTLGGPGRSRDGGTVVIPTDGEPRWWPRGSDPRLDAPHHDLPHDVAAIVDFILEP